MLQAFWRAVNSVFGDKITFKTTLKGASMMMNSAIRDLWMPGFCFFLLFATMIAGLVELFTGKTPTISLVYQRQLLRIGLLRVPIARLVAVPYGKPPSDACH